MLDIWSRSVCRGPWPRGGTKLREGALVSSVHRFFSLSASCVAPHHYGIGILHHLSCHDTADTSSPHDSLSYLDNDQGHRECSLYCVHSMGSSVEASNVVSVPISLWRPPIPTASRVPDIDHKAGPVTQQISDLQAPRRNSLLSPGYFHRLCNLAESPTSKTIPPVSFHTQGARAYPGLADGWVIGSRLHGSGCGCECAAMPRCRIHDPVEWTACLLPTFRAGSRRWAGPIGRACPVHGHDNLTAAQRTLMLFGKLPMRASPSDKRPLRRPVILQIISRALGPWKCPRPSVNALNTYPPKRKRTAAKASLRTRGYRESATA